MRTHPLTQFSVAMLCFATFVGTASAVDLKPGKYTGTMQVLGKWKVGGISVKKVVPIAARVASEETGVTAKILVQPSTVEVLDLDPIYYFFSALDSALFKADDDSPYPVTFTSTATSLTIERENLISVGNTASGEVIISHKVTFRLTRVGP